MNDIEYVVITSDKYVHLMEDYSIFFNKYWNIDVPVTILSYAIPEMKLPNNFKFFSLGNQSDFGNYWTNALIPYFNNIKSEFICILLDDLFFITPVDTKKLFGVFDELISENKTIDKFLLGSIPENMTINSIPFTNNSLLIHKNVNYRTTLKPSIWRTEYFKKMLKPNYNVWDFEIKNMYESKTDGSIVISHKDVNLITEFNVYYKGAYNVSDYNNKKQFLNMEEIQILSKYNKGNLII